LNKVPWRGDDFIHIWWNEFSKVLAQVEATKGCTDELVVTVLLKYFKLSAILRPELITFKRMQEDHDSKATKDWLIKCVKRVIAIQREERNEQQKIAGQSGGLGGNQPGWMLSAHSEQSRSSKKNETKGKGKGKGKGSKGKGKEKGKGKGKPEEGKGHRGVASWGPKGHEKGKESKGKGKGKEKGKGKSLSRPASARRTPEEELVMQKKGASGYGPCMWIYGEKGVAGCPNGSECWYSHDVLLNADEKRVINALSKKVIDGRAARRATSQGNKRQEQCRKFAAGDCRNGDSCPYAHTR